MSDKTNSNQEIKAAGFGTTELAVRQTETAALAVAEQAKAEIQAQYIVAMQHPRDMDTVRLAILKDCHRPGFAAVAKYSVPRGGKQIVGASIRFAEAAIRCMKNIRVETKVTFDDESRRVLQVSVTDLESNVPYSEAISLDKTIERQQIKEGQEVLGTRRNSYGKPVYLVRATEDDLRNKQNAQVSKALRGMALRLLPGDILEEAMAEVDTTLARDDQADPDAARKKLADAYAQMGVMPTDLKAYLGHDLAQCSQPEMLDLRAVYMAIRDGETTWADVLKSRTGTDDEKAAHAARVDPIKAKLNEKLAGKGKTKPVIDTTAEPAPATREPGEDL